MADGRVLDRDAMRVLCEGIGFLEGPIWTSAGELLVTSISRSALYRIDLDGGAEVFADVGGAPTGLAEDRDGNYWIAQSGSPLMKSSGEPVQASIQVWSRTDGLGEGVTGAVGAPNDCALGPDGRIWFSDTVEATWPPPDAPGRICSFDPRDPSAGTTTLCEDVRFPNGLAFGPDGSTVFIAESATGCVKRFDIDAGKLTAGSTFVALPEGAVPDGLDVDAFGRVYVATFTGNTVCVIDPDGTIVDVLEMPGLAPSSVSIVGKDRDLLAITTARGGQVVAIPINGP